MNGVGMGVLDGVAMGWSPAFSFTKPHTYLQGLFRCEYTNSNSNFSNNYWIKESLSVTFDTRFPQGESSNMEGGGGENYN